MIKAVLFDFDGVLVESVDIKTKAFVRLFEKEGKGVARAVTDYHLKHTGVSRFEKFKYIYNVILKKAIPKETFDKLCRDFSFLVVDEVVAAPYVKGGKEFLDAYSSMYKCFVVSATPQQEIEDIIEHKGMRKYFAAVYGSPGKKADAVKKIITDSRLAPDEIVYIGDARSDYEAALANRTHFIARINNNEPIFKDVDCVKITDLSGLKSILDRIGKP